MTILHKDQCQDIWVFIELREKKPRKVGLELLGRGRELAKSTGQRLAAVVIGDEVSEVAAQMSAVGADLVYLVEGAALGHYTTDGYTQVFAELIQTYKPNVVLFGATSDGCALAARLAARLGTGLAAGCTGVDIAAESAIVTWTRPAYGGMVLATLVCPDHRPQMGTVRPAVFACPVPNYKRAGEIIRVDSAIEPEDIRTKLFGILQVCAGAPALEEAEVIVAGGRGMGREENFSLLERLAKVLGGIVGASRAAVESEWIHRIYQVGQTGKFVRPKIYFACGISGAREHLAGMAAADIVIAVNLDPAAPIFQVADFGIVGDVVEVLPLLTEQFKQIKGIVTGNGHTARLK